MARKKKIENQVEKQEKVEEIPSFSAENQNEPVDTSIAKQEKTELEENQEIVLEKNDNVGETINLSQELVEEKLSEAISAQKPQKRRKTTIISLIFLLINIILMTVIIRSLMKNIGEQNFFEYVKMQGARLWWLLGGLACYMIYMFTQTGMFHSLIKSLTGQSRWKLSYDVGLTGKYYDNITPFSFGGQPMQIFQLASNGINPGISTSMPLMKTIINTMTSTLLAFVFFVFGLPRIVPANSFYALLFTIFEILGIIGLITTCIFVGSMIFLSTGKLFARSLVSGIAKLGYKMKLIKNYRLTLKKWLGNVSEYSASMSYLFKNKKLLFKMIIYSCLESLSYACISFFVIMAFMDQGVMASRNLSVWTILFTCVVKYYICAMAGSYIPLPGATGLMEIAFIALYGEFVGDAIVWTLLTWRILSYYLILVHGFVHEICKITKNFVKAKKEST